MGANELTGINSDAIKTAQHKDMTKTASHAGAIDESRLYKAFSNSQKEANEAKA